MRQYVIDELRPNEIKRIKDYLDNACETSDIGGLYWIHIPDDILSPVQYEHQECQPHCSAVELGDNLVKFEMLVRSRKKIRCNCVQMATSQQRNFILAFADKMMKDLGINV